MMDSFGMTHENDFSAELARPTFDSQDSGDVDRPDERPRGVPAKLQKLLSEDLWALFAPDSDTIPYIYEQFTTIGDCEWRLE